MVKKDIFSHSNVGWNTTTLLLKLHFTEQMRENLTTWHFLRTASQQVRKQTRLRTKSRRLQPTKRKMNDGVVVIHKTLASRRLWGSRCCNNNDADVGRTSIIPAAWGGQADGLVNQPSASHRVKNKLLPANFISARRGGWNENKSEQGLIETIRESENIKCCVKKEKKRKLKEILLPPWRQELSRNETKRLSAWQQRY